MLDISFPTTIDGYQQISDAMISHAGGGGFSTTVPTVLTRDAPAGKQFLGCAGELVAIDADGNVIDVLPVSVVLVGSAGANCTQVVVTGLVPDTTRSYRMQATAVAATQPLNPGH